MSPKSHSSAGCLRPAAWSGALALLLLAADAGGEGMTLRLDRTLSQHGPEAVDEGTAILLRFGSSEIQQQIQLTRARISRLERTNQELAAAISSGDELMSALKELQGLQDQVQKGVREAVDARADAAATATATAAATARPAPETAAQPAEAPAVRPVTRTRVRTAPAPVEAPTFEIPIAGLPQWAVAAALGVIILALLGWMAMRFLGRARRGVQMPEPARAPSPVELTVAPATSTGEPAGTDTLADDTVDLDLDLDVDLDVDPGVDLEQADPASPAQSQPVRPPVESEERWSNTLITRKAADPQALREVDTLIAFEQYEKAKALLDEMMVADPDNPELALRHYHVRTQGGIETTDDDEALLRAMMDGPLSDTMKRVRNLGRGLMPGDPLFDDPAKRAAVSHALKESKRGEVEADDAAEPADDDTVVQFTGTVKLERSPLAGN